MDLRTVGWVLGATLTGAVALRALLLLFTAARRISFENRRQSLALDRLRAEIDAARARKVELEQEQLAWTGWRKFQVKEKRAEAEGVLSFVLVPHDQKPLPRFKPGQYLTFQFHVPGQPRPSVRCYSCSERPRTKYYRITVKRVLPFPGKAEPKPGLVSNLLATRVMPGDILDLQAPKGHFILDTEHETPVVLVGGGIGVTPVLSMLNYIAHATPKRETWFFYGVRDGASHPFKQHLEKIAQEQESLRLHVCYSHPRPQDAQGKDYHHAEHVSVDLFKRLLPSNNYTFYVCGPPAMMESIVKGLEVWGVPRERIRFEAFGPASLAKERKPAEGRPAAAAGPAATVRFARSDKTIPWNDRFGCLLDLALANDIQIPSGCRVGNCSSCLVAVKSGEVSYKTEPGAEVEKGSCLTCIGVPKGPLELDA